MLTLPMLKREPSIQTCAVECGAKCCSLPTIVVLTDKESARLRIMKAHAPIVQGTDGRWAMLTRPQCVFLADDKTCSIYEQRPSACRAFPIKLTSYCLLWSE